MASSNYLEQQIVEDYLRTGTVYVALFTTATDDADSTGVEVSGGAYARKAITFTSMSGITTGTTKNSSTITFAEATANWGTIRGAGIYDALTGGNLLYHHTLTTNRSINTGDTFQFVADDVVIVVS